MVGITRSHKLAKVSIVFDLMRKEASYALFFFATIMILLFEVNIDIFGNYSDVYPHSFPIFEPMGEGLSQI